MPAGGATKYIIRGIWQKGAKYPWDERQNVKQLLAAAGRTLGAGAEDESARLWATVLALCTDISSIPLLLRLKHSVVPFITPRVITGSDGIWLTLAEMAKILIPLPGKAGIDGVFELNKWFKDNNIKYNTSPINPRDSAGNRATYGFSFNKAWAIQKVRGEWNSGPVEMDCTTYVNLMLSIYISGDAHTPPYDGLTPFGGNSEKHCARDRYGFPLVTRTEGGKKLNYFQTFEQISTATQRSRLYLLEIARAGVGSVEHMALLYDWKVYEYAPSVNFRQSELKDFVKKGLIYYLFGPR